MNIRGGGDAPDIAFVILNRSERFQGERRAIGDSIDHQHGTSCICSLAKRRNSQADSGGTISTNLIRHCLVQKPTRCLGDQGGARSNFCKMQLVPAINSRVGTTPHTALPMRAARFSSLDSSLMSVRCGTSMMQNDVLCVTDILPRSMHAIHAALSSLLCESSQIEVHKMSISP
jgi:hypothetical protein